MKTVLKICLTSYLVVCFLIGLAVSSLFTKPPEALAGGRFIQAGIRVQELPEIFLVNVKYDLTVEIDEKLMGDGLLEVVSDNNTLVSFDSFSETGGHEDVVRIGYSNPILSVKSFREGLSILKFKTGDSLYEVPIYVKEKAAIKTSISIANNDALILGELSKPVRIDLLDSNGNNSSLNQNLEISFEKYSGLEIYNSEGQLLVDNKLIVERGESSTLVYIKQILPTDFISLEINSYLGHYSKEIEVDPGYITDINYDFSGSRVYEAGEIVGPIKIKMLNEYGVNISNDTGVTIEIMSSKIDDILCGTDSTSISSAGSVYLEPGISDVFCIFYKTGDRDLSFIIDPEEKIDNELDPLAFSINPGPAINLEVGSENIELELGEQEIISINLVDKFGNSVYSDSAPNVQIGGGVLINTLDYTTFNIVGDKVGEYLLEIAMAEYSIQGSIKVEYGQITSILPNQFEYEFDESGYSDKIEFRGYNRYGVNVPSDKDYVISSSGITSMYDFNGSEYVKIPELILKQGELLSEGIIKNEGDLILSFSSLLNEFTLSTTGPILANSNVLGVSIKDDSSYRVKYIEDVIPLKVGEESTLTFMLIDGYGNTIIPEIMYSFNISKFVNTQNAFGKVTFEVGNCVGKMKYTPDKIGLEKLYIYNEWSYMNEFIVNISAGSPSRLEAISVDSELENQIVSEMFLFQLVDEFGNRTVADQDLEFTVSSLPSSEVSTVVNPWNKTDRIVLYEGESVISFYIKDSEIGSKVIELREVKHLIDEVKIYYVVGK